MIRLNMIAITLAVAVMTVGQSMAFAQTSNRVPVDENTTRQKAVFVHNLVTKSSAVKTIESSGDEAAKASLAKARALVDEANADLGKGDFVNANGKLDEALAMVNGETRKLSQDRVKGKRVEEAYEKRLSSVKTLLAAYDRVSAEKGGKSALTNEVGRIRQLVAEAEGLAASGKTEEAKVVLDEAYLATRGNIRGLREGDTLTRTLTFETPKEEYEYEIDRNDSHAMLVDIAMQQNPVPDSMKPRIGEHKKVAKGLREQAEKEAGAGNFEAAIDKLGESTSELLKAIRMTGIFIPG